MLNVSMSDYFLPLSINILSTKNFPAFDSERRLEAFATIFDGVPSRE
jgi:hypothetical protein